MVGIEKLFKKKDYIVKIEETVVEEFVVSASSEIEALEIAKEKYHTGEFILTPGEVQFKQVAVVNQKKSDMKWVEF